MKKRIMIALSAVLSVSVLLSGCAGSADVNGSPIADQETTETYIALTKEKLEGAGSFAATFHAEVDMGDAGGMTRTEASVNFIREPLSAEIKTVNYYGEEKATTDIYLEDTKEDINMYMAYDNQWTEMTLTKESAMQSVGTYDAQTNMSILLSAVPSWEEVSREKQHITLTGMIPAEKVYTVSEAGYFLRLVGLTGIGETYFANVTEVPVEIEIKEDGTPISYSVDFSGTLQSVLDTLQEMGNTSDEGFSVKKYVITQDILQLNDIKSIEIPAEARSAINYEREIKLIESSEAE